MKRDPSIATVVSGRFIRSKSDAVPFRNEKLFRFQLVYNFKKLFTDGNEDGCTVRYEPTDVFNDVYVLLIKA